MISLSFICASNYDENDQQLFLLLLLLRLRPLLVILRFPIQLERVPYSSSLDLVLRSQAVRDRVDRGLYGSVEDHRLDRGQVLFCSVLSAEVVARSSMMV